MSDQPIHPINLFHVRRHDRTPPARVEAVSMQERQAAEWDAELYLAVREVLRVGDEMKLMLLPAFDMPDWNTAAAKLRGMFPAAKPGVEGSLPTARGIDP